MYQTSISNSTTASRKPFIPWMDGGTLALQTMAKKIARQWERSRTDVAFEPVYGHNQDLPDKRHQIEQGYACPINTHLEPRWVDVNGKTTLRSTMDGAHFRELCVQRGGANHVLHLKSPLQLQPKTWMRPEYVASTTGIPYDLAYQVVRAFETLGITRWHEASWLLNGVQASGKIWTPRGTLETGIANKVLKPGIKRNGIKAALYLIDLARQLEPPDGQYGPGYELDEVDKPISGGPGGGWKFTAPQELVDMYHEDMTYGFVEEQEPAEQDDELDSLQRDNAFSSHRLCGDGKDALPYSFQYKIMTADEKELKRLAAGMFIGSKAGGSDPEFEFSESQRAFLRQVGFARYRFVDPLYEIEDPVRVEYMRQCDRIGVTLTDSEIDIAEMYIQDPKSVPAGSKIDLSLISKKAIKIPKEYWHFSSAQQKHFWALWKTRKATLAKVAREDPNRLRLLSFVKTASKREAVAAIFAYRDRQPYELFGFETILDGNQEPSKETLTEAWTAYKERA